MAQSDGQRFEKALDDALVKAISDINNGIVLALLHGYDWRQISVHGPFLEQDSSGPYISAGVNVPKYELPAIAMLVLERERHV